MVESPPQSKFSESVFSSIPPAHEEYEKMLRYLEQESRLHIQNEQQMRIQIDTLQETVVNNKRDLEKVKNEADVLLVTNKAQKDQIARLSQECKELTEKCKKLTNMVEQKSLKMKQLMTELSMRD